MTKFHFALVFKTLVRGALINYNSAKKNVNSDIQSQSYIQSSTLFHWFKKCSHPRFSPLSLLCCSWPRLFLGDANPINALNGRGKKAVHAILIIVYVLTSIVCNLFDVLCVFAVVMSILVHRLVCLLFCRCVFAVLFLPFVQLVCHCWHGFSCVLWFCV